jgi:pilus assembly protein CpaF
MFGIFGRKNGDEVASLRTVHGSPAAAGHAGATAQNAAAAPAPAAPAPAAPAPATTTFAAPAPAAPPPAAPPAATPASAVVQKITEVVQEFIKQEGAQAHALNEQQLVAALLNRLAPPAAAPAPALPPLAPAPAAPAAPAPAPVAVAPVAVAPAPVAPVAVAPAPAAPVAVAPAPTAPAGAAPGAAKWSRTVKAAAPRAATTRAPAAAASLARSPIEIAKQQVQPKLMTRLDVSAATALPREELARQLGELVAEILVEEKLQLNKPEQRDLVNTLLNDMLGLGPLEPLIADETLNDIMVNGARQVYVERAGKLELTNVAFRDDAHVMNIATRIVSRVGRRIDESTPLCDARLLDGSRVNIIIPPLAIDGPSISIRKFSKKKITLDVMVKQNNLSPQMADVLRIAGRSRLNVLISGGTGSGKTTLLNAISQMIDLGERIVTIEDAAELQLQQPHVVRLETRPANLEGEGEINMRDLVKNALRMRPDRIILGEVRGAEAVDMLQAMNTGHEGSLGTIHANRPREALTRLENMVGMTGINLPSKAVRTQIAAAIDMVVQVSRMRDGVRRITQIMEVVGMEGDVITTQDLFQFEVQGEAQDGRLIGKYKSSGLRPHFTPKAAYFGLEKPLIEAIG